MAVPTASLRDTAGAVADVVLPLMVRGAIVRRQRVVGLLDRLDADRRAVRRLQRLRERYGTGPVVLGLPGRKIAIVLSPAHVHRVLNETPEPFSPATLEKRAALSRFQPHGVLISEGPERAERRRLNEEVLEPERAVHSLGGEIARVVDEEADELLRSTRVVGWDEFAPAWWRMVRRVVLGKAARDDHEVTDMLARLRGDANWAYLVPKRRKLRAAFLRRVGGYIERAEPGSLAALVAAAPSGTHTHPHEQVPHWLFAFDAAGMSSMRALALLDAHPEVARRARDDLIFLRACLLEAVRLWPTTPAILRDATAPTTWESGSLPAGTGILIFSPFFHRDDQSVPFADSFSPDLWMDGGAGEWPLVPFSEGPAVCPGRSLVLQITSLLLARLVEAQPRAAPGAPALDPQRPLPRTLSPFRLTFEMANPG